MTAEHIGVVVHEQVFNPRGSFEQLAANHVPFDELAGHAHFETAAMAALDAGVSVAVIAPVGAGKSSLIAYVCSRLPDTQVALRAPVVGVDDPTNVSAFAAMTLSNALDAIRLDADQRELLEQARADTRTAASDPLGITSGTLGGGPIPAAVNIELGTLREQLEMNRLGSERLVGLERLIGILVARGQVPVFVLEDTEAAIGGRDDLTQVDRFLAGPLRAFVRELGAPSIVAVQSQIAASKEFRALAPELRIIEITSFADERVKEALHAIVAHRLAEHDLSIASDELIAADATEILASFYAETGGSLRHTLAALQTAADHAANAASEVVGAPHTHAAVQEWRTRLPQ